MKTETVARPGIVDALSTGLIRVWQRPWLMLIPVLVDLGIWLAPRLSIQPLVESFVQSWQGMLLQAAAPGQLPNMDQTVQLVRDAATQIGSQVNLMAVLGGSWLGAPSVVAMGQATRMTFITDLVLAPAGLSLNTPPMAAPVWQSATMQIRGVGSLLLVVLGLWLLGQITTALYLRWACAGWQDGSAWDGLAGFLRLVPRLALFSIIIMVVVFVLRLPLAIALTMLNFSNSSILAMLALMFAGVALWLTLWFLTATFFVNEAILLEGQPVGRSIARSATLVHQNFGRAIGLVAMINLLLEGFRVVWGYVGQTPLGAALAILGNAYLATSMLMATFAFYEGLRKATVPQRAKAAN
jgi:hypothetical protein